MATLQDRVEQLINVQGQALGVLKTLTTLVGSIAGKLKDLKGGGGAPKPPQEKESKTGLLDRLKTAGKVIAGVVGALAAIPATIIGLVKTANSFVRALNPSLVERYETEIENLTATIGFGLTPVTAYATRSVKEFAQVLLPSIQRIKPVVDQLARAVSGAAGGAFRLAARVAEQGAALAEKFAPFVATAVENLANFFDVVGAVVGALQPFQSVVDAIGAILNANNLGLKTFATALAVASAKLLGAFGGAEALNRFKAGLAKSIEDRKKDPTGGLLAAPKDVTTGGIEDVLRKLNERAFLAGDAAETKPPDVAALEAIFDVVKDIKAESLSKIITDAVKAGVAAGLPGGGETARRAADVITGAGASTGFGRFLGGVFGRGGGGPLGSEG